MNKIILWKKKSLFTLWLIIIITINNSEMLATLALILTRHRYEYDHWSYDRQPIWFIEASCKILRYFNFTWCTLWMWGLSSSNQYTHIQKCRMTVNRCLIDQTHEYTVQKYDHRSTTNVFTLTRVLIFFFLSTYNINKNMFFHCAFPYYHIYSQFSLHSSYLRIEQNYKARSTEVQMQIL